MQNADNGAKRTTLVEEGTAFKGEFSSDCPIIVKGRIEGNVSGPSLTVSATGAVAGVVKVGVIESEGELAGQFEADVVRLSGRVCDNTVIRAKSLEVKLAPEKGRMQVVFGECSLDVGDMPSKEAARGEAQTRAGAVPQAEAPQAEAPAAPQSTGQVPSAGMQAVSVAGAEVPSAEQAKAEEPKPENAEASEAQAAEGERPERKNGMKNKGRSRPSTMPPPPA